MIVGGNFFPLVSVIIPTYNAERTLPYCLQSIISQEYPREKVEVIVVDGGSRDKTREVAEKFGVDKIIENPYKGQEFGKALGVENAEGELIAFIDSDNVLPDKMWFKKMVKPFFDDSTIVGSEPLMFTYRPTDPYITRYISLLGCDDPLPHILGNRDRWSWVKKSWTDLHVKCFDRKDYIKVIFDPGKMVPTMGANGFIVRKECLKRVKYIPYIDIDVFYNLVKHGYRTYAKVKTSIIHLHASSITQYLRKKIRRLQVHFQLKKYRTYPWHLSEKDIHKILMRTTIPSLALETIQGYRNIPDKAWLLHPIIPLTTILIYVLLYTAHLRNLENISEV